MNFLDDLSGSVNESSRAYGAASSNPTFFDFAFFSVAYLLVSTKGLVCGAG
jgi:hypothetical protein